MQTFIFQILHMCSYEILNYLPKAPAVKGYYSRVYFHKCHNRDGISTISWYVFIVQGN